MGGSEPPPTVVIRLNKQADSASIGFLYFSRKSTQLTFDKIPSHQRVIQASSHTQTNSTVEGPYLIISQNFSLSSREFKEIFESWAASGSTRSYLGITAQRKLPVVLPPLSEQKAIAHILGTLDDKIELNRRMNETLEEMARAIFKDWFVNFGPTRAKMEGRAAYLPEHIWSLFPGVIDNETGLSEGWKLGKLGDIAKSENRIVNPTEIDEETPYIGLEHMPRRSIALSNWEGAKKVTSNKLKFQKGEFLFGKLRPYFHKVGIAPLGGICSTDIVVLHGKDEI